MEKNDLFYIGPWKGQLMGQWAADSEEGRRMHHKG